MRPRASIVAILAGSLLSIPAGAEPLRLPVARGEGAVVAPAYLADRLSIRLSGPAARRARARVPAALAGARPVVSALGIASLDRAAAALGGARFEPEFAGESPPAEGSSETDFTAFYVVKLRAGADLAGALDLFRASPDVIAASPIAVTPVTALAPPNDSLALTPGAWWLGQPSGRDIHALEAWERSTGDTSLVVAILDTGVVPYHPDLGGTTAGSRGQIWTNRGEQGGVAGVDDDGNGFLDDTWGWDFVDLEDSTGVTAGEDWRDEDDDPNDFVGHGTSVAGLVGAATDNGIGIASAARNVRLMPLRVGWSLRERQTGVISVSYLAQAVRYATRMKADVINISLSTEALLELGLALEAAEAAGVTVVVAAGNNGSPDYAGGVESTISVTATDPDDVVPPWANVGPNTDLAAPGAVIATTTLARVGADSLGLRQGGYVADANGTSYAAPLASGAAILIQSLRRSQRQGLLPPGALRLLLMATADDIRDRNPDRAGFGTGRLDVARAMELSDRIAVARTSDATVGSTVVMPAGSGSPWMACATANGRLSILRLPALDTIRVVDLGTRPVGGVAAADLGGGRGLGLFVALENGGVAGFTGSGVPLPGWPVAASPGPGAPLLGDLDGDGVLEVVFTSRDSRVWAWSASGQPRSGFPVVLFPRPGLANVPAALADLDGVPGDEIVAPEADGTLHAVRGDGHELVGWPVQPVDDPAPSAPVVARGAHGPVIVVAGPRAVRGILPSGAPVFRVTWSALPPAEVAAADLDDDGEDEVAVLTAGAIQILHLDGTPFGSGEWPYLNPGGFTGSPVIGPLGGTDTPKIVAMAGGSYVVLDAAGRTATDSLPIPRAGPQPTLARVGSRAWLVAGSAADGAFYAFDAGATGVTGPWPTHRGNFARTGCQIEPPPMAEVAPDPVTDLAVTSVTERGVALRWTASGDDGRVGRCDHYDFVATADAAADAPAPAPLTWRVPATVDGGAPATASLEPVPPGIPYRITVTAVDAAGQRSLASPAISVTGAAATVGLTIGSNPSGLPVRLYWRLHDAGASSAGIIRIYDVGGRLKRTLRLAPGRSGAVTWDGRGAHGERAAAGLYFATLSAPGNAARAKFVLTRR